MAKLITVFDDNDPLNNVVCELSLDVSEIYYVYHHQIDKKTLQNNDKIIKKYKKIKTHYLQLKDDEKEIMKILNSDKTVIADVGGAKYLSLVLFELAYKNGNQLIYYDDEENVIKDYLTHKVYKTKVINLKAEDILKIGGGTIKSFMHEPIKDYISKRILVKVVENNIGDYPGFVRYIGKINSLLSKNSYRGRRTYQLNKEKIHSIVTDQYYKKSKELFTIEDNKIRFASEKIKDMVCTSGTFLENYLYIKLMESKKFDDVMMSVVVDFSNDKYNIPVVCEIDCLVVKNNKMLFVSCKSSKAETSDINEIYVHNSKFGNLLSKPVLCVGEDLDRKFPSIYAKAEELNVYVVDKSSFLKEGIANTFTNIVNDKYVYDELKKI